MVGQNSSSMRLALTVFALVSPLRVALPLTVGWCTKQFSIQTQEETFPFVHPQSKYRFIDLKDIHPLRGREWVGVDGVEEGMHKTMSDFLFENGLRGKTKLSLNSFLNTPLGPDPP
ncbi:hypothetical protein Tco_1171180 [Tanacetum coccineum]